MDDGLRSGTATAIGEVALPADAREVGLKPWPDPVRPGPGAVATSRPDEPAPEGARSAVS
jgi:hypothetical protein